MKSVPSLGSSAHTLSTSSCPRSSDVSRSSSLLFPIFAWSCSSRALSAELLSRLWNWASGTKSISSFVVAVISSLYPLSAFSSCMYADLFWFFALSRSASISFSRLVFGPRCFGREANSASRAFTSMFSSAMKSAEVSGWISLLISVACSTTDGSSTDGTGASLNKFFSTGCCTLFFLRS